MTSRTFPQVFYNARLEAALAYHLLDWSVIPLCPPDHAGMTEQHRKECTRPGKRPLHNGWLEMRLGELQVRKAWEKCPNANVGVVMGQRSNLCGLDVDGQAGWQLLREWLEKHGPLPHTPTFETPGGGVRYLFRYPAVEVPHKVKWMKDGKEAILWMPAGTQTVAPPSIHPAGGEYCWVNDCRPGEVSAAELPGWILDLAAAEVARRTRERVTPAAASPPVLTAPAVGTIPQARRYLIVSGPCDPRQVNEQQDASQHLFKACCALVVGFALDDATALELLREWDQGNRLAPYPARELVRQIAAAHASCTKPIGYLLNREGK
jgi:Bifunctional DNA primase/polymerase, N-terminal